MKTLTLALLLNLTGSLFTISAQEMIKVDLVALYDQVTPPPVDVKEAVSRCAITWNDNAPTVSADKPYAKLQGTIDTLTAKFGRLLEALNKPMMDAAKKLDQKEIEKKMKGMSQAEQIQYAMQLNQQLGVGNTQMVMESSEVNAAVRAQAEMTQRVSTQIQMAGDRFNKRSEPVAAADKKHKDIDEWMTLETSKLPQISGGEMSAPEPKAYKALQLKAMDKHIAVENDLLKSMNAFWYQDRDEAKKLYRNFQDKLIAIHYGDDVKNLQIKKQLITGQSQMLVPAGTLLGDSRERTLRAAQWVVRRQAIERQKID